MTDLPSINYTCTIMHAGLLGARCCSLELAAAGVLGVTQCSPALGVAGLLGGSHAQASMNAFEIVHLLHSVGRAGLLGGQASVVLLSAGSAAVRGRRTSAAANLLYQSYSIRMVKKKELKVQG